MIEKLKAHTILLVGAGELCAVKQKDNDVCSR